MQTISHKPLIFIESQNYDKLTVELRQLNYKLDKYFNQITYDFEPLSSFVDANTPITRGIDNPGEHDPQGIPIIKIENMLENRMIDIESLNRVSPEVSNTCSRSILKSNDIVISIAGTIGRLVKIPVELNGANITRNTALIRLKNLEIIEFIMLYLESELAQLQFALHTRGGAVRVISLESLRKIKIPKVNTNDQKLMVKRHYTILSLSKDIRSYSEKFLNIRKKAPEKLDKILTDDSNEKKSQSLWDWEKCLDTNCAISTINEKCAIVRNLNQDRLDPRYSLPQRLRKVVSKKPNEWCSLSDHASVERKTYNSNATLEHIAIDEMPNDPWQQFDISEGYVGSTILLEKGDIAISRLMPTILNGKCFMAWKKMTGSAEFIRVRIEERYQKIILFWLKSAIVREFLLANVRGSSASQKRFTEDDLKNLPIPKDIIDHSKEYLERCEKTLSDALDFEKKSYELKEKSNMIIQKAKSNIFNLLDDSWFNSLLSEAKEVLK